MPTCFTVNLPASNVHYVIYGCSLLMSYPGHAMHQGNMDMEQILLGLIFMLMDDHKRRYESTTSMMLGCPLQWTNTPVFEEGNFPGADTLIVKNG